MHVQSCCFSNLNLLVFCRSRLPSPSSLYKLPNAVRRCAPVAYHDNVLLSPFPELGRDKTVPGSKLNSRVNKVTFPHFCQKFIIAAILHNKLNLQWNKRNAIYFTIEFHAVTRRNSLDFKYSGKRYVLTSFKTCFQTQSSQTGRGFPHETRILLRIKFPSFHLNDCQLLLVGQNLQKRSMVCQFCSSFDRLRVHFRLRKSRASIQGPQIRGRLGDVIQSKCI